MEKSVQNLLINRNAISEQHAIIKQHGEVAANGNANSTQLVKGAKAKKERMKLVDKKLNEAIAKDASAYESILTHPKKFMQLIYYIYQLIR